MSEIELPKPDQRLQDGGQVVAYEWARQILYHLGCGCRRDGDYLFVYRAPDSGFYARPDTGQELLRKLYIDEGFYSGSQHEGGEVSFSKPWLEYVDFVDLSHVILKKLSEKMSSECHGGDFLGEGRRQRHRATMVRSRLMDIDYWSHDSEAE